MNKNYFSHTSLDGISMSERISRGGINSLGHRKNMLEQSGDLGVGSTYNGSSTYGHYHTQNFARMR